MRTLLVLRHRPARRAAFGPLLLMFAGACGSGGGTEIITPPPPPPVGFTFTFRADPEDAATAQALGWSAALPGLAVTVTPKDSSTASRSFTSSAQGTVTISDLTAQDYIVEADRWLTDAERAKLTASDDATGFVTRSTVRVAAASGQHEMLVPASRRKSLVISEWAFNTYYSPIVNTYDTGGFIELYNNADTTVYLDGFIIAEGWTDAFDYPNFPCSSYAAWDNDPQGIWARFFAKFPGTGRDHALLPGKTVVVATDAIDHRPFVPGGLDLSHADFEFIGSADIDNPAVPNMVDVGVVADPGHGLFFRDLMAVPVLVSPSDPSSWLRGRLNTVTDWARIPAERIVDAFVVGPAYVSPDPECPIWVNQRFERAPFRGRGSDQKVEFEYSVSRRAGSGTIDGHRVLQHSRSGAADFVRSARTPGQVP